MYCLQREKLEQMVVVATTLASHVFANPVRLNLSWPSVGQRSLSLEVMHRHSGLSLKSGPLECQWDVWPTVVSGKPRSLHSPFEINTPEA